MWYCFINVGCTECRFCMIGVLLQGRFRFRDKVSNFDLMNECMIHEIWIKNDCVFLFKGSRYTGNKIFQNSWQIDLIFGQCSLCSLAVSFFAIMFHGIPGCDKYLPLSYISKVIKRIQHSHPFLPSCVYVRDLKRPVHNREWDWEGFIKWI